MATTLEAQGDKRPVNEAGMYVHKESGKQAILKFHPKFGGAQGDAFVRLGYERVGDAAVKAEAAPEAVETEAPSLNDSQPQTKTLSQMNKTELTAEAEKEGIDPSKHDTNKKLADAIRAARK